jgi:hypothetical protein
MSISKTSDLIGLLHVIGAGEGPEDHQKVAIQQLLARYVSDAQQILVRDPESNSKIRSWVADLSDALTVESERAHPGRLGVLVAYASEMTSDWVRKN